MTQEVLIIESLPASAVEAAARFHAEHVSTILELLDGGSDAVAIVLPAAPVDHDDWRRAITRDLARAHAPKRVNMVGGTDGNSISAMLAYLRDAPGITGQYLVTHE